MVVGRGIRIICKMEGHVCPIKWSFLDCSVSVCRESWYTEDSMSWDEADLCSVIHKEWSDLNNVIPSGILAGLITLLLLVRCVKFAQFCQRSRRNEEICKPVIGGIHLNWYLFREIDSFYLQYRLWTPYLLLVIQLNPIIYCDLLLWKKRNLLSV